MTVFDLDPLSPNVLVAAKRRATTLTPTLVLKRRQAVPGDQHTGGDSQDQQILNVLLEMIVFARTSRGDRSAARQLAAPVRIVRFAPQRAWRAGIENRIRKRPAPRSPPEDTS